MYNLFILFAVSTVAAVCADQYSQPYGYTGSNCPTCDNRGRYYQDQSGEGRYRNQNNDGRYNQNQNNDGRYYQNQNNDGRYNQQPSNTGSYYQQGGQMMQRQNPPGNAMRDRQEYQRNDQYASQTGNERNSSDYSESQLQTSEKKFPQDFAANPFDRQVNAKIRDKLNGGWFSKGYDTLVIKTTNGVVIISGNVDKIEDVQKLAEQIQDIEGVKSVVNQLVVKVK